MSVSKTTQEPSDSDIVETVINDFLARQLDNAITISSYYQHLWTEIARLMNSGGKRLRPRLAILSYRMFGGQDTQTMIPAAVSLELLHLGMLIHDDIIDRDYVRYGVDNVAGGYIKIYDQLVDDAGDRLHYAHSAALLAGDLLMSEAYGMMAESALEPQQILAIQKMLGQSIVEVIGGELLDTENTFREHGAISSEQIARYKTASYTTILPMLVGAQLAGVSKVDQVRVRSFGINLGIAFQLRDDILGVFGDEAITGKTNIGDIREGKRTYMIEQFYLRASDEERSIFDAHFGNSDVTYDQAAQLCDLLKSTGALDATEASIGELELKARSDIAGLDVQQDYLADLNTLITALLRRIK